MEPHLADIEATTATRSPGVRTRGVRRPAVGTIALAVLLAGALAVLATAGPAGAATLEYRAGTTPVVWSYGRAHCQPAYLSRYIEIGSPLTTENPYVATPGIFTVGGGQRVQWTPFLQRWNGSGWSTVWIGATSEDRTPGSTAHWGSVFVDVWSLRGGGSGYYRAGGVITWNADATHFGGQQVYLLSTGEYLAGGGANAYLSTRLTTPWCAMS
jgi:hypothetical protein